MGTDGDWFRPPDARCWIDNSSNDQRVSCLRAKAEQLCQGEWGVDRDHASRRLFRTRKKGSVQESEQTRIFADCRLSEVLERWRTSKPRKQLNSNVYRPFRKIFANQGTE